MRLSIITESKFNDLVQYNHDQTLNEDEINLIKDIAHNKGYYTSVSKDVGLISYGDEKGNFTWHCKKHGMFWKIANNTFLIEYCEKSDIIKIAYYKLILDKIAASI